MSLFRQAHGRRGTTLLETILAVVIMAAAGLALVAVLQKAAITSLKARERTSCGRLAQAGISRLKNIDYFYLFAVDSNKANWATPALHASYPYTSTLTGLKSTIAASKFDRFQVDVTFMRRDSTDAQGTGLTSNLIAFKDNGAGVDQYDPNVKYDDQNGDGDYYETYSSGGKTISEQPDTHMKLVTLTLYRQGRSVCSHSELISLEQFAGQNKPDSEAVLFLEVSTPTNNSYAYQLDTAAQIASHDLAIAASYPSDVFQYRYRADATSPLPLSGQTNPLSTVNVYVGTSASLANVTADVAGAFSLASAALTTALSEGSNTVRAQSTKSTYTSPWAERTVILDVNPPSVSSSAPGGTVSTRQPYVNATLVDPVSAPGAVASGICPSVIGMKVNGAAVSYSYNASSGTAVWIDSTTQSPPILADGTYTVAIEAGDYAGYKTSATWTFTVSVPVADNSAPSIANKSPIGSAGSDLPLVSARIFDNQSGIDPSRIAMTVDGAPVTFSYDPNTGTVSWLPPAPYASMSFHNVTISVSHYATSPADKVTSTDNWSFVVP